MEGNALTTDWNTVCPRDEINYVIGNPPFVGNNQMNAAQRKEILPFFPKNKTVDYVGAWFYKAAEYMKGTEIRTAFVSTNSITQGEQVAILWQPLYEKFGIHIDFGRRTFRWDSEANQKAHVHCVITGFSCAPSNKPRLLFDGDNVKEAANINAYLTVAPDIFITSRSQPICDVPKITKGNQPTDGGNLIIEAAEYEGFIRREPTAKQYIKKLIGAKEYINKLPRYCLWLVGVSPAELRRMPLVMERVKKCRDMRMASTDAGTRRLADTPPWMRTVCGRLEMRYRYSKDIVYNNFPWPEPTAAQRARIEAAAQAVLDARSQYPDSSLADLYDDTTMPYDLRQAHRTNDRAVLAAYGISPDTAEEDVTARLFALYKEKAKG